MVAIREATPGDWRAWRAIRLRSLTEAPEAFASSVREWTVENDREDRWVERMEHADVCLLAEVDGSVVGLVALDPEPGGCQLVSMFVAAEARRLGVGRALVADVVAAANGRPLRLRVMASNTDGVAFYESVGFVLEPGPPDLDGCLTMRHRG